MPSKLFTPTLFCVRLMMVITCALVPLTVARAQWVPSGGGNDISNTNTGNVGIGTTAPTRKLTVTNTAAQTEEIISVYRPASANTSAGRSGVSFEFRGDAYSDNPNVFGWTLQPNNVMAKISVNPQSYTEMNSVIAGFHANLGFFVNSAGHGGLLERMTIRGNGNVGIGTTTPAGLLQLRVSSGDVIQRFDNAGNAGGQLDLRYKFESSQHRLGFADSNGNWLFYTQYAAPNTSSTAFFPGSVTVGGNISAKYQDVAEWVDSSQQLMPGTVVVLDASKANQVVASAQAYDSRVAGVISEQPGVILGEQGEGRVLVATTGRVKVRVDATNGPIQIGDLLVTSGKEGLAMKSVPVEIGGVQIHRPGTLIGKALEPIASGQGSILVLLSLQ